MNLKPIDFQTNSAMVDVMSPYHWVTFLFLSHTLVFGSLPNPYGILIMTSVFLINGSRWVSTMPLIPHLLGSDQRRPIPPFFIKKNV